MVPDNVSVPVPTLVTAPVPVMFPDKPRLLPLVSTVEVPATLTLLLRARLFAAACKEVPLAIANAPVPSAVLLPTAIVPALRLVPPL